MSPTKKCCRCHEVFPVSAFYKNKARPDGLSQRCHECDKLSRKDFYYRHKASDPTAFSRQRYADGLKYKYGITIEQYDAMLAAQNGGCAVCEKCEADVKKNRLHVDHAHATGEVRGLLCTQCNMAVGNAYDNPERLEALAAYLRRHQLKLAAKTMRIIA